MSKRKPITERMKIDALLNLMWIDNGFECKVCAEPIKPESLIDWDHALPLALGGDHHYGNLRPLHRDCHRKKTSGTKATSAGSDIHKIAKAKRIAKGKMAVNKLAGDSIKSVRAPGPVIREVVGSTPTPAPKRKMQSRGFSKPPEGYKHNWRSPPWR